MSQVMMNSGSAAVKRVHAKIASTTGTVKCPEDACSKSAPSFRHPYDRDAMWVELYCGKKPCSECPRSETCEDYDGAPGGMPETFNPPIYR